MGKVYRFDGPKDSGDHTKGINLVGAGMVWVGQTVELEDDELEALDRYVFTEVGESQTSASGKSSEESVPPPAYTSPDESDD